MAVIADWTNFTGTSRFELIRRLGAGGMGVVYEVYDHERRRRIALKTLRDLTPGGLLRFKQEFRSLQDLRHVNLVALDELHSEGGRWFFTMELVLGAPFLDYVCGETIEDARDETSENAGTFATGPTAVGSVEPAPEHPRPPAPPDLLRAALRQLATGVVALHEANKVHRDLKPSNVLVTKEGRVVILDFGLLADFEQELEGSNATFAGTPLYMAPEQAAGGRIGPAADWYGVGVMIYEALTGVAPHCGTFVEVMSRKQRVEPKPARALSPGAPDDLLSLCEDLLRIDPAARPTGRSVLARLGLSVPPSPKTRLFVGRALEQEALWAAYRESRKGRPVTVFIHGESGVGKTALARRFSDDVRKREKAGVLWGRYYERELVPFKAFDGLLDDLVRFLAQLSKREVRPLLPDELPILAQVFPVLRDLIPHGEGRALHTTLPPYATSAPSGARTAGTREDSALAHASTAPPPTLEPQEQRRLLYRGVRTLLTRTARLRPMVLVVDDVQWADRDSRALFADVMRPRPGTSADDDPPPVLLLATDRMERSARARWVDTHGDIGEVHHVVVDPLPRDDARALATALLGERAELAASIADEAEGHPLFINELARQALLRGDGERGSLRLEDALVLRLEALDTSSRRLIELVAVRPGPLPLDVAAHAVGLPLSEATHLAEELRVANLLRPARAGSEEALVTYHDRVRAAALSLCDGEARKEAHRRLALAYEDIGHQDPEALATHYVGAGDERRAAHYLGLAAARTATALAFDRAANLYRQALALTDDDAERRRLVAALGHVLALAGRGEEAADAFLAAADGRADADARTLRRLAADQLLRSGNIDRGMALARDVLRHVGLRLAKTPRGALFGLLARRLQLWFRGLSFKERPPESLSAREVERIDSSWAMASGLALVDTIAGAHFQTRHLLLALAAGDPMRIARALAVESAFSAADGGPARERTKRLCAEAARLAARVDQPYAIGWARATAGFAATLEGRFDAGRTALDEAESLLRAKCSGIAWEISAIHFWRTCALSYLGDLRALAQQVEVREHEVEERGDLFGATGVRANYATFVWMAKDDPARGREQVSRSMKSWSQQGFQVEHWWEIVSRVLLDLYEGLPEDALAKLDASWKDLRRGLLLRVQLTRVEALSLRARAALASAVRSASPSAKSALLVRAERDAAAIHRENMKWSAPLALLLAGGIASARGQRDDALAKLAAAQHAAAAADMRLHEAAARHQRGLTLAGAEGQSLAAAAREWMSVQGIVKPARLASVLAPTSSTL